MTFLKLFVAIFLFGFLVVGSELYKSDQELGIERDIYNFTESKINLPSSNISSLHPMERIRGIINQGRLYKIVESGVNFIYVSIEQVSKMGIEYGYQNPQIDFELIFKYLLIILIIIIFLLLLKPIGYLIIFLVMLIMMIIEKRKKRKEK